MGTFADHITCAEHHVAEAAGLQNTAMECHPENSAIYTGRAQVHATLALAHLELAKLARR